MGSNHRLLCKTCCILHPNFPLIYFCSLLGVCFIDFYFYLFIVTTKICERSVKYELEFGTGPSNDETGYTNFAVTGKF